MLLKTSLCHLGKTVCLLKRSVQFVLGDEASSVDGELVIGLALVEACILRLGRIDLQLALHDLLTQTPFANLRNEKVMQVLAQVRRREVCRRHTYTDTLVSGQGVDLEAVLEPRDLRSWPAPRHAHETDLPSQLISLHEVRRLDNPGSLRYVSGESENGRGQHQQASRPSQLTSLLK